MLVLLLPLQLLMDVVKVNAHPPLTDEQKETLQSLNLSLHLNSAAAFNNQENWTKGIDHATRALEIDGNNVKALYVTFCVILWLLVLLS